MDEKIKDEITWVCPHCGTEIDFTLTLRHAVAQSNKEVLERFLEYLCQRWNRNYDWRLIKWFLFQPNPSELGTGKKGENE